MKIGSLIRDRLKENGRTVTWFASQVFCTRTHAYKIFEKTNIDTELLMRISRVLDHDFFKDLSDEFNRRRESGEE